MYNWFFHASARESKDPHNCCDTSAEWGHMLNEWSLGLFP